MEFVGSFYHIDQLLNHEIFAFLQRGLVLNFGLVVFFFKALFSKNRLDSFFIHALLNLSSLLAVLLFIFYGFSLADVDRQESGLAARPQLTLIVLWNGERLDEGDPSVN